MVTPDLLLLLLIRFAENVPSAKQKKARKGKERKGKERQGKERKKGGEGLKKFQI